MLIIVGIVLSAALLFSVRVGTRAALPVVALSGLVAFVLLGSGFEGLGLAPFMGWIAVYQMERGQGFGKVMAGALLPVTAFCLWLIFLAGDPGFLQERSDQVTEQFAALGVEMDPQVMETMIQLALRVQPSVEFVSMMLSFLLAFRLAFLLAPRFGMALPEAPPMTQWRPWDELIWVLIGALVLAFLGVSWLEDVALNAVVVMSVVYAAQGLGLLRFFTKRHGVPRALELTFYIALLFVQPGLAMIALAFGGLLDTWFDWRRLRPVPLDTEEDENQN
jgi:hypothetical protein